jgi:hypothetical protein
MTSEWIGKVPRDLSTPTGPALNQCEDVRIAHCANAFFEQRVALWARSSVNGRWHLWPSYSLEAPRPGQDRPDAERAGPGSPA